MERSRVFITQEVSTVDYSQAAKWGDIIFITSSNDRLSPIKGSLNNRNIIDKIHRTSKDFKRDDLLVCSGSPAVMAISAAIIGDKLERILSWDAKSSGYFEVRIT